MELAGRVPFEAGVRAVYVMVLDPVSDQFENGATSGAGVLARYSYDTGGRLAQVVRGSGTVTTYNCRGAWYREALAHRIYKVRSSLCRTRRSHCGRGLDRDRRCQYYHLYT